MHGETLKIYMLSYLCFKLCIFVPDDSP